MAATQMPFSASPTRRVSVSFFIRHFCLLPSCAARRLPLVGKVRAPWRNIRKSRRFVIKKTIALDAAIVIKCHPPASILPLPDQQASEASARLTPANRQSGGEHNQFTLDSASCPRGWKATASAR